MKKEARAAIAKKLQDDYKQIQSRIASNRYLMKKMVTEQTILKRQLAEYHTLIRSLQS